MADALSRDFDRRPLALHSLKESLQRRGFDVPIDRLAELNHNARRSVWRWIGGRQKRRPAWLREYMQDGEGEG